MTTTENAGNFVQELSRSWTTSESKARFILMLLAIALCLCRIQAFAADPESAEPILAKWQAAIHKAANSHSEVAELARTNNADGLRSVEHVWINREGSFRKLIERRQDNSVFVVGASGAWYRDWNGHVRPLAGEQLQRLRTEILEESTVAFGPSAKFESAQVRKDEASSEYILILAVEGGQPITWFIDAHTFLPVKSVRPGDDGELTTEYSRWQKALGGTQLPHVEQRNEQSKPQSVSILRKARRVKDRNFDWGRPDSLPESPAFKKDVHQVIVPFNFETRHIMISCRVNGSPEIWFLVDTGAGLSIINEARLSWFGVSPYGQSRTTGGGGSADSRFGFPANFNIAGVELQNQHVGLIDLSGLESVYGMQMGGLLGYDFLRRFVTEIDYEKSTLTLHDPETWSYTSEGYVIPLEFDNGIPQTSGRIAVQGNWIPARFVVDFGAADTINFASPFVASHELLRLASTSKSVNRLAGAEKQFFAQTNIRGRIDALTLGGLSMKNVPANLSIAQEGAYASTRFSATIGEGIFSRFHVFLDYPNQRVILEPTADLQKAFPGRSTYGLTILASGDDLRQFKVTGVRAGSPAEKQGFRVGDIISEVDGTAASSLTLGGLKKLFNEEGRAIAVRISRVNGTEVLPVVVSLVSTDGH